MNHNEITKLRRYLNENFNKKFIRINYFEIAVFILFVKKFDKNFRFCVNYKNFNAVIVKNRYFLFLIFETFNRFNQVKIFIKLDIIVAFNKIRIRKKNEFLIVFRTRFKLFEYLIMFFDLCNESISFQNYINDIFREYFDDFCIAYFDDILIYNNNEIEHKIHVNRIFKKLFAIDLQVDIIKCAFHVIQIFYLNLIIIIEKVKMNSIKIDIIVN